VVPGQRSKGLDELRIHEPRAMPAVDRRQCRTLRRQSGLSVCAHARTTAAKRLANRFFCPPVTRRHVGPTAPLEQKGGGHAVIASNPCRQASWSPRRNLST